MRHRLSTCGRLLPLLCALLLLFAAPHARAQFESAVEGTVHDSSGAVVPGAKVTLTDTRLGIAKTTTTNNAGYFRIGSIGASNYSLQIEVPGFTPYQQTNLNLQVGETRTLAPDLQVGTTSSEVTVSAEQATLNLSKPTTGSIISEVTVHETPLIGQNVYGLASLTPGITGSGVNSGDNFTNEYAININAAGLRQEQNGYQIDGAYTNTPSRGGGTSISPNPEIVESVDIRTNNFDAQKGRNGGATVDVFTKSGTKQLHGTGDYYFLNDSLQARTEFQTNGVPPFTRQEGGISLGGPVFKDKLFLYGAIDVLRSSTTTGSQYTVETQDFVNWAKANRPNAVATQVLTTAPPLSYATANIVTAAQLEATQPGYFAPPAGLPGNLPVLGTANISYATPKNGYQWSLRGDSYLNEKDRIYAEFVRTSTNSVNTVPRTALNGPSVQTSDFANLDYTHTFSPRLLNEAGASMIRPFGASQPASTMAIPLINVTGLTGFSNWGPGNFTQTTIGWRDVLTSVVKTHTLKVGFQEDNIREADTQSGAFDRPTYNFNSILDFVQDKALTESSTPVSLITHQSAPYNRRYRALITGIFVQDDWKASPRLTINAGLRYDMMNNFFSALTPQLTNFVLGSGSNAQRADRQWRCPRCRQRPRPRPQHLGPHTARRLLLRRLRQRQNRPPRRLRRLLRSAPLHPPHRHHLCQSPQLLHALARRAPGTDTRLPAVQRAQWLHHLLPHRRYQQRHAQLRAAASPASAPTSVATRPTTSSPRSSSGPSASSTSSPTTSSWRSTTPPPPRITCPSSTRTSTGSRAISSSTRAI